MRRTPYHTGAARQWIAGGIALLAMFAGSLVTSRSTTSRPEATRTYRTAIGQRATITLTDGSRIVLGPRSQLRLTKNFGRTTTRLLDLQGEAYFDVTHAAGAPFIVRTGAVTTRVLGTTFGVRRHPGDTITHVVVTSGKVVTGTARSFATLVAGMLAAATDSTTTARSDADAARYTEWTRGRIVFDQMPVPVLLSTLGRWYGYEFKLADSALMHRRVSGEFRSDALPETLAGLRNVLGVTLAFEGKTVILRSLSTTPGVARPREKESKFPYSTEAGR